MHTRIEHLSLAALRMAASGLSEDTGVVARWLYHFGTVPRGPAIDRDFGPDDDPMAVLGMTVGGGTRRLLETAYEPTSLPAWYSFARSTAQAAGNGLLSSGVDPPPGNAAASWRSWVTKRLAASLTAQRATPCEDPVAGALADIRLAGVDPKRWLPNADAF